MAYLAQKPEMPSARLAASFWNERQFHGVEEGKGIIRDHLRHHSCCCLALMAFWRKNHIRVFRRHFASLVSLLGEVGDLVVALNESFCHEDKFVVVVVVVVVVVIVVTSLNSYSLSFSKSSSSAP